MIKSIKGDLSSKSTDLAQRDRLIVELRQELTSEINKVKELKNEMDEKIAAAIV